ncbi:hypothetical protein PR202_gb25828 [Eleusine coracana subsp. coracana]|uniref:Knottins-like domain-containing protein n=1 Tax=Eleusine coracana subsp. coracana TaxID=191504 RepID=A0AAV5FMH6_ELECO|nr:hypothetical protein QOZ80_4BG0354090 [Eleusine coracana subsp. coracana]GJN36891.1 hypothetical protein PR202_gb25792 [Eleusine coracana subsp. coracana]GJN36924.1 hypothetical protein PR202_gb25828 [Eleusine coracana subsp. coracana]
MESPGKFFPVVAIFLLLVVATDLAVPVQARSCVMDSEKFKGLCISSDNCGNVCRTEGFYNGACSAFKRSCRCVKPC